MVHWHECYGADELDQLAQRRQQPSDPEDEQAWFDLGTLVNRFMHAGSRLKLGDQGTTRFPVEEIFNYWDQSCPPLDVADCLDSWHGMGVPVHTYDWNEADDFLKDHFGGDVLTAFRYAHHPAMQADLFRLGRLLTLGGLYVDADDVFRGAPGLPSFAAGAAVMPLAVCRHCPASLLPLVDDPGASHAWYYVNNAPLFSKPGHPLIRRTLDRAVGTVMGRRRRGELCQIHQDTGPSCLSMTTLDYAIACFVSEGHCDLSISPHWPFMEQALPLAYKETNRNWRTNSVLYQPPAETAATIDLEQSCL